MANYQLHTYDSDFLVPANGLERLAAALCHGAVILALPFLVPLGVFVLFPLIQPSAYVRHQAIQAMLFHLFFLIVTTGLFGLAWAFFALILIGWPFAALFGLLGCAFTVWAFVVMFIATLRAFQGRPYRMPVVGNWGQ